METTKTTRTKKLVLCGLFAALVAIGAFIQIPVPYLDYFTLQFFFVVLAGLLLGPKLGAVAVAVYVVVGLAGFPVFAAGGGITYVLRPSFGYLLGFILAAFLAGFVSRRLHAVRFSQFFCAALAGFAATYAVGLVYKYCILNFYTGVSTPFGVILLSCFPLDMPGDLVLCVLAAAVAVRLQKAKKGGLFV